MPPVNIIFFFVLCQQFLLRFADGAQKQLERRFLLAEPGGIFDKTVDRLVDYLDSRNISEHILRKVGNITPPIDQTPGINSVTRLFELLPPEARNSLANLFPDTIDFPGTQLWEAVAKKWLRVQEKSEAVHDTLEKAGLLESARDFAKVRITVFRSHGCHICMHLALQ